MHNSKFIVGSPIVASAIFCLRSMIGLCCLLVAFPAAAAEFRWEPAPETESFVGTLYLDGPIQQGDRDKLLAALGEELRGGKGYPLYLQLNSKGGNFSEAIKIADVALDRFLTTRLGPHAECLSACAVIFMSGMSYNNTYNVISRFMHPTAKLGFHAPVPTASGGSNFDDADLEGAYSSAVEQIGKDLLKVARYRVSDWPNPRIKPALINEMMIRRDKDFYYIDTVGKAADYEIELDLAKGPAKVTTDNRVAACQNTLALWTDRAGADEASQYWLNASNKEQAAGEERHRAKIEDLAGVGPFTYSYHGNRAKGRYCDVTPRGNFGSPPPSPTSSDMSLYTSNFIALGLANGGKHMTIEDWYFWPPDKLLADVPTR